MKHKTESRRKNTSQARHSQGKTIAITGRKPALNGLDENQKAAIHILAEWGNVTPEEYVKTAIAGIIEASIGNAKTILRDGRPDQKKEVLKVLSALPEPFRPPTVTINLAPPSPGVIPESLRDEAKAALDSLLSAGQQAVTLLAMTTHALFQAIGNEPNYDPIPQWRQFVDLNVEGGIPDLSVVQASRFKEALENWQLEVLCFFNNVVNDAPKILDLEQEVYSLNAMLHLLAQIYSDFYATKDVVCGQCNLAWNTTERLHSAWENSFETFHKFKTAFTPQPLKQAA